MSSTKTLDPYAPIQKRRLATRDGMTSRAYTVRLADDNSHSGWREVGVVSDNYLLVPNAQVRDLAIEVAERSGLGFTVDKTFFDGKRFMLALVARERGLVDVRVGDPVGLGMMLRNSYDGSTRLSASLFVHRLACSNGMVVPKLFREVTFKHDLSGKGWEKETARTLSMLDTAQQGVQQFAEAAQRLASMRVGAGRLREVRTQALPRLPVSLWGKVLDRFLLHEQLDGFGLLNAGTNVLWHDEKPTASTFSWNEYLTTGLVEHALGETLHARRN